jgi:hypothetical protein
VQGTQWHGSEDLDELLAIEIFDLRWRDFEDHTRIFLWRGDTLYHLRCASGVRVSVGQAEELLLTVPKVRRLLLHLVWERPPSAEAVEH